MLHYKYRLTIVKFIGLFLRVFAMNNLDMVNSDLHDTIIKRIEDLRKEKGYTQKKVSSYVGISEGLYSQWINGKPDAYDPLKRNISTPTLPQLIKLAGLYGVTIDYLVGYQDKRVSLTGLSDETIRTLCRDTKNLGTLADTLNTLLGKKGKFLIACCRFFDDIHTYLTAGNGSKFYLPDMPDMKNDMVFLQTPSEDIGIYADYFDGVFISQITKDITDIKNELN